MSLFKTQCVHNCGFLKVMQLCHLIRIVNIKLKGGYWYTGFTERLWFLTPMASDVEFAQIVEQTVHLQVALMWCHCNATDLWTSVIFCNNWLTLFHVSHKKWTGYNEKFGQWKIKKNHNLKSKLTQKLYDDNTWHVTVLKPIIFPFLLYLTSFVIAILVNLCCSTSSFVPKLEARSVVPGLITRDSKHCYWPYWGLNKMVNIFAGIIFKCIFLNEIKMCLVSDFTVFHPKVPIKSEPALNQVIPWHLVDNRPLPDPMLKQVPSSLYYNMTVWHFGPCVTFWPCLCEISARLVWHFGPLVRNEGKRVSPYPHINHWRRL